MANKSKNIPEEFRVTTTPMLSFKDASAAIEFYEKAFGAVEITRLVDASNGKVTHAEIRIGAAPIMLSDEFPEIGVLSPETIGGSPVMILLLVPNVDEFFNHAIAAGAKLVRPIEGDDFRNGKLDDPFGHRWMIMTRKAH